MTAREPGGPHNQAWQCSHAITASFCWLAECPQCKQQGLLPYQTVSTVTHSLSPSINHVCHDPRNPAAASHSFIICSKVQHRLTSRQHPSRRGQSVLLQTHAVNTTDLWGMTRARQQTAQRSSVFQTGASLLCDCLLMYPRQRCL